MRAIGICLWLFLSVGVLAAGENSTAGGEWHSTWLLEALGIVAAIVLAGVLWFVRKILATFIHLVVLLLAVGFLLLAIFGRELGVYDQILGTSYASERAPAHRLRQATDEALQQDPESYDESSPTFGEFYPDLE